MSKKALSDHQKQRIYQLCEEDGFSQAKVAKFYNVSQGTVSNVIKDMRYKDTVAQLQNIIKDGVSRGVQATIEDNKFNASNQIGLIDVKPNE